MFRRFVAVVVLALAAVAGGGGVAYAADPTPASPGMCSRPPTPKPLDAMSDKLDITAPATFGDGLYSTYGWSGFTTSTVYDPGCWDRVMGWVADRLTVTVPGTAASFLSDNGPNRPVGWGLAGIVFVASLATTTVRFAVGDGALWSVLDVAEGSLKLVTGANVLLAFVSISCALTGLWFMFRARTDPLRETTSRSLTAAGLLTAGALVSMYQLSAAPTVDQAVQSSYVAAGQVATGQTSPGGEKVDAGTVVADALAEGLVLKVWGVVHLGPHMDVVDRYAPRLFAAQAFTRAEAAQAETDPDYRKALLEQKHADYRAVAAEIQQAHPDSYAWLADNSDQRLPWVLVGLLATTLVAVVIGGTAAIVAASRVAIRLLVGAFPGIAALTMIPPLQKFGRVATEWVVKLPFIAAAATAALMVFIRSVMDILAVDDQSWFTVLVALCIVCALLVWAWDRREQIAKAAGVSEQKHAADVAARAAADAAADAAARAAAAGKSVAGHVTDRARADWDRRNAWRDHPEEYETFTPGPRPATPPVVKAPADPAVVTAAAAADVDARTEKERLKGVPDPVTTSPAKARRTRVQDATAAFSSRPTEETLTRREAVKLAAKSAQRIPAKATTATTRTAAKAASTATVANAVKVMAPRSPAAVAANVAVATIRK